MRRRALALILLCALAGAAPASASKSTLGNTLTYTAFDALTATLRRLDGRRGVLTVQGGLDVQDPALRARAAASGPRLRDAYIRTLDLYAASLTPGAPPDVDQIGFRLQQATDGVLRRKGAKVLLGTIIVN